MDIIILVTLALLGTASICTLIVLSNMLRTLTKISDLLEEREKIKHVIK